MRKKAGSAAASELGEVRSPFRVSALSESHIQKSDSGRDGPDGCRIA